MLQNEKAGAANSDLQINSFDTENNTAKGDLSQPQGVTLEAIQLEFEAMRAVAETSMAAKPDADKAKGYRFDLKTLDELYAEPEEELSYIWDDTLITGGFSILSGKPKVGKSTFIRPLAVAISRGDPMLNRQTAQRKVLYLCLEAKRGEVRKHFAAMQAEGDSILMHSGTSPNTFRDAVAGLKDAIDRYKPALVVIDPLSRILPNLDWSDYRITTNLLVLVDLARQSGSHILACHHDGKGGREDSDALLGSTALFGSVDCHLQIKKRTHGRTITSVQRYGEDLPETVIELNKETGLLLDKGKLEEAILADVKAEVLESVGKEFQTQKTIKEALPNRNGGLVSKAIKELVNEDILDVTGTGKRNDPYYYGLPQNIEKTEESF